MGISRNLSTVKRVSVLTACVVLLSSSPRAQSPGQAQPVFRTGTELVTVNVVVRDKSGAVVRGLTQDDFIITEDDKPQQITSFDFEELDKVDAVPDAAEPTHRLAANRHPRRQRRRRPSRRLRRSKSTCVAGGSSCCSSTSARCSRKRSRARGEVRARLHR